MSGNIWFTSDFHIGHKKIIGFSNRPFVDLYHMKEAMIKTFNFYVAPNDEVYHLGDFSFAPKEETADVVSRLNGHNYILAGNHDRSVTSLYECGFERVWKEGEVHEIEIAGMMVKMCHFPYWHESYAEWDKGFEKRMPKDDGSSWLLHGHDHRIKPLNPLYPRTINVGVDAWDYRPVHINEIAELIRG